MYPALPLQVKLLEAVELEISFGIFFFSFNKDFRMTDIWHSVKIPDASGLEIWIFDLRYYV